MGCVPSRHNNHAAATTSSPPKTLSLSKGSRKEEKPDNECANDLACPIFKRSCSQDVVEEEVDTTQQSKITPGPDPRRQILTFFSTIGSDRVPRTDKDGNDHTNVSSVGKTGDSLLGTDDDEIHFGVENSDIDNRKASVFTVWRPCSSDAIKKMVEGQGVGKGLDIKGKSAKAGVLSGFVPYLQIHEEAHKSKVQTLERGGRTRIFFASRQARDTVMEELEPLQNHILNAVQDAKRTVKRHVAAVGFGMADAGRSTSKVLYESSTSAITNIQSSVSATGSSIISSSIELMSTMRKTESGASIEGDDVANSKHAKILDNTEISTSEPSRTQTNATSITHSLGLTSTAASTVVTMAKHSSDLVFSTTDMISPINDGIRKGASVTVATMTSIGQTATDSVTDIANRATSTAKSSLEFATTTVSSIVQPVQKSFKELTVKGLGLGVDNNDTEVLWALKRLLWDMDDPSIRMIDNYSPSCYGIELPDRLLWQAFVVDSDISRPVGSKYYNARPSQPAFQDMNFIAISKSRKARKKDPSSQDPLVVLYQTCRGTGDTSDDNPMDPRGLVMAYEECGRVLPVVSDFDCFTMGSRNVRYATLSEEQLVLLDWCITSIEQVLESQDASKDASWTDRWLQVLKSNATTGFHPIIPKYGFGDSKSYEIVEEAVSFLQDSGAVRHGAECFNFYFPQELDDEFLIVSESFPEKWRYVSISELQDFLLQKIQEGYTFPLNPKWILCDDLRWKSLYDQLLESKAPYVKDSINSWFPESVRSRIESIRRRYPDGFLSDKPVDGDVCGTEAMDLAMLDLDRHMLFRKAKIKIFSLLFMVQLLESVRRRRRIASISERDEEDDDDNHTEVDEVIGEGKHDDFIGEGSPRKNEAGSTGQA